MGGVRRSVLGDARRLSSWALAEFKTMTPAQQDELFEAAWARQVMSDAAPALVVGELQARGVQSARWARRFAWPVGVLLIGAIAMGSVLSAVIYGAWVVLLAWTWRQARGLEEPARRNAQCARQGGLTTFRIDDVLGDNATEGRSAT